MKLIKYNPAFLDAAERARRFGARHQDLAELLRVVRENLGRPRNQHVLIVAPRGMGKTTLVLRLVDEVAADAELAAAWFAIAAPEELYRVTSIGELWLETVFGLHRATGDPAHERAYENLKRAHADHAATDSDARLAEAALAYLLDFADRSGKRLLLIAENLQMLFGDQLAASDAWSLRATLIGEPRIMLLASAVSAFEGIEDPKAPLYEQFLVMRLHPLDLDECLRLWQCLTGTAMPRRRMRAMQILTGGNPRLLVILAEFAAKLSLRELTEDLANLLDEHTDYLKMTTEALPPLERKVFVTLAEIWEDAAAAEVAAQARVTANVASAQLARLESRGVVVSRRRGRGKQYRVAERLYGIYHLMRRRGGASARARAVTEFMVAYYDRPALLRQIERMAHEALSLAAEDRSEHLAVLGAFVERPGIERRLAREASIPRELREDPRAPESLRRWRRDGDVAAAEAAGRETPTPLSPAAQQVLAAIETADDLGAHDPARALEVLNAAVATATLDPRSASDVRTLAAALRRVSVIQSTRGTWLAAAESAERAVEVIDAVRSVESAALLPDLAGALNRFSNALSDLGRREDALAAIERAAEIHEGLAKANSSAFLPPLARSLNSLSSRLSDVGRREEALAAIERATEIAEGLAKANPSAFLPVLAMSLNNLSNGLSDLGRREEALAAIERAAEIYERLAKASPSAFLRDLASSLNNLSNSLADVGRREEALAVIERAAEIREGLAKANPSAFLAALARSLNNLSNSLSGVGRREEALATIERAAEIHEGLARANPSALLPELARSLNILSICLSDLGRGEEALAAIERAAEIDEGLAKANPSAFLPDLAMSLNNLSNRLSDLGRREEALAAIERAAEIDANLAKANPSAFLPDVAMSLKNLSNRLSDVGRLEEALAAIQRAVEIRRQLASSGPTFVLPLANALATMARTLLLAREPRRAEEALHEALALDPQAFDARVLLGQLFAADDRGAEALDQLRHVAAFTEELEARLRALIDLAVAIAAGGHARETLEVLEASPSAPQVEPLIVALARSMGREVSAPDEVDEIAADIMEEIAQAERARSISPAKSSAEPSLTPAPKKRRTRRSASRRSGGSRGR